MQNCNPSATVMKKSSCVSDNYTRSEHCVSDGYAETITNLSEYATLRRKSLHSVRGLMEPTSDDESAEQSACRSHDPHEWHIQERRRRK